MSETSLTRRCRILSPGESTAPRSARLLSVQTPPPGFPMCARLCYLNEPYGSLSQRSTTLLIIIMEWVKIEGEKKKREQCDTRGFKSTWELTSCPPNSQVTFLKLTDMQCESRLFGVENYYSLRACLKRYRKRAKS